MKPAHPILIQTSLGAAEAMAKMGVEFVPMPILGAADHCTLADQMLERLKDLAAQEEAKAAGDQQLKGYRDRLGELAQTNPVINNALRLAQQGQLTYQAALEMLAVTLAENNEVLTADLVKARSEDVRPLMRAAWMPIEGTPTALRIEGEMLRRCLTPESAPGELAGPDARDVVGVYIEGHTMIAMHYRVAGDAKHATRDPLRVEVMNTLTYTHTLDPWSEARRLAAMMTHMRDPVAVVDGTGLGEAFAAMLVQEGANVQRVNWGASPIHEENRFRFGDLRAMSLIFAGEAIQGRRLAGHNDEWHRRMLLGEGTKLPYTLTLDSSHRYHAKRTPRSEPSPLFDTLCMAFLELQQ